MTIRTDAGNFETDELISERQGIAVERMSADLLVVRLVNRTLKLTGNAAAQAFAQLTEQAETIEQPQRFNG